MAPAADLCAWIDCYWSLTGHIEAGAVGNRVLPDGCMDVILRFGDPPVNRDRGVLLESFVVGAMTAPAVVWQTGWVDVMGVRFRPGGAAAFLAIPAAELTDDVVQLDVFWREAGELFERTAAVRAPASDTGPEDARLAALGARELLRVRSRVVEAVVRHRAELDSANDGIVSAAVRLIEQDEGRLRIDTIEQRLGITQRSLERRFKTRVGLSPKIASRIARFQGAAKVLQTEPRTSLARLAAERGYHDQAHMTREFRQFAGLPPAAYALERTVGFVQDPPQPLK